MTDRPVADLLADAERGWEAQLAADRSRPPIESHDEYVARWIRERGYRLTSDADDDAILRAVSEARLDAARAHPDEAGLDYEQMRKDRGWPTPNHMRRTADALDAMTPARYGDVLRWFADLADAAIAQPAVPVAGAEDWTALANDIRTVDGNHDLGAGALAAALTERGWLRAAQPEDDA